MNNATTDFIVYAGQINRNGYAAICDVLSKRTSERAVLVLATPGGDAHAGFRIARALQHSYGSFDALIPRYCKSAGTLVLIGAKRLFLANMSELGPLDVQIKKGDEIVGMNSGLDIFQAVNYLQGQAMVAFRQYLIELNQDLRLSTKMAAEISTNLTLGMMEPIAAQIDPMKLAEMQRATEIAFAYGNRLNENSNNLRADGLRQLVTGYPSHGFVIDRREARVIFTDVRQPEGVLLQLSDALRMEMESDINTDSPKVKSFSMPLLIDGATNEHSPDTTASSGGNPASKPEVHGTGEASPTSPQQSTKSLSANATRGPKSTRRNPGK